MKTFFGSFLGALFAIFFLAGLFFVGLIGILILVGSTEKGPKVPANSLLVIDLSVPINDAPQQFDPSQLLSGFQDDQQAVQVTLREVLEAIRQAAGDPKIKGVFLTGNLLPVSSYASTYP